MNQLPQGQGPMLRVGTSWAVVNSRPRPQHGSGMWRNGGSGVGENVVKLAIRGLAGAGVGGDGVAGHGGSPLRVTRGAALLLVVYEHLSKSCAAAVSRAHDDAA